MCIIGELGKLLLEEIPLEETPPGYGRAPYLGYDKTESAVNEATKCVSWLIRNRVTRTHTQLATVRFAAGSANPKPPGLPPHNPSERLTTPQLPNPHDIAAAEEFAHFPGGADADSPQQVKGKGREYSLDNADPYGGLSNPYEQRQDHAYSDFGGTRGGNDRHVMFQGPSDDHIQGVNQPQHQETRGQDYEYEQQRQLDEEERAWRETDVQLTTQHGALAPAIATHTASNDVTPAHTPGEANGLHVPWQPLKVNRDRAATPVSLRDGAPRLDVPDMGEDIAATSSNNFVHSPTNIDLPPPPPIGGGFGGPPTPSEAGGFYTPMEGTTPEPTYTTTIPAPPPPPAPAAPPVRDYTSAPGSGKISASAFRRGPKRSTDPEEMASPTTHDASPDSINRAPRRLPQPPGGMPGGFGRPETPIEAGFELPSSPTGPTSQRLGNDAYGEAAAEDIPPPQYHAGGHNSESLR